MKRKLDIACGLLPDPKVLFLDEPTLGLDVQSRLRIWDYVRMLKARCMTVVMTTNYLDEAEQLCDRLAIIDSGTIKTIGSPVELKVDRPFIYAIQHVPSSVCLFLGRVTDPR